MKKTIVLAVAALISLTVFAAVTQTKWNFDNGHQKVAFSVSHMTISDCEGYFKDVQATITSSGPDFKNAVAEMTIKANSVNTDNEKRDEHLRSADFFDVSKYPTITFKSTSFTKGTGAGQWVIKGNFTMHGVTKPVSLAAVAKTGTNPFSKKETAGFKVIGTLNRKDFGLGESTPDAIVGNTVTLSINAEFIKE